MRDQPAGAVPLAGRTAKARRRGRCSICRGPVLPGQRIARVDLGGTGRPSWSHHLACLVALQRATVAGRTVAVVPVADGLL